LKKKKKRKAKKNQRWFSRPTSENALAQSRMIVALLLPSIVVDGLSRLSLKKRQDPLSASTQLVLRSRISFI
jgi:hypothetical protein